MDGMQAGTAVLSSCGDYTGFRFGKHHIRFRTSTNLERYTSVAEWDHGYLVVMAKYSHRAEPETAIWDLRKRRINKYSPAVTE